MELWLRKMWLCTNTTLWLGKSCRKWSDSLYLHSLSARKDEAKTVGETSAVKVTPESRSNHWFCTSVSTFIGNLKNWRLIIEGSHELYELSPFPSALFEARNVFRKADKPQLASTIFCDHARDAMILDSAPETLNRMLRPRRRFAPSPNALEAWKWTNCWFYCPAL